MEENKIKPGPVPVPPERRFREHVVKNGTRMDGMATDCWEWDAACDRFGFPVFGYSPSVAVKAHRYAYELKTGKKLAKRQRVKHVCGNKRCVRGSHIKIK